MDRLMHDMYIEMDDKDGVEGNVLLQASLSHSSDVDTYTHYVYVAKLKCTLPSHISNMHENLAYQSMVSGCGSNVESTMEGISN